ncbi:MAG TPA: bifunctional DNA-formamidopyrimidine glycosylase/DNA-(apurinic or apyrimidinic site) lyase [Candidatus Limnocylindrales bacterium]
MPELPEVETIARDLRPHLVGATISGARLSWPRTLRTHEIAELDELLAGRRVEAVGRRGKQLVIDLSGGAALTVHLKMTGQLFVVPVDAPDDPYVRLALALADGRELRFRDIRKFGRVGLYFRDAATGELVTEPGGAATFASTGPEPLDDRFTLADFRHRIRARKGRLKPLLTDQSFLAGVGNIYADEALWAARLHPLRSAASLRPADERRLYEELRAVLTEAIRRRGSSIDDYTAPDGDGSMQEDLRVYQRTGEPCFRCGRPIRRIVVGGRSTHFCSWCQRLPAAERRRAGQILRGITPRHGTARGQAPSGTRPRGWRRAGWPELGGALDGATAIGLTAPEAARVAARERAERTQRAAATRRAAARGSTGAPSPTGRGPDPHRSAD